MGIVGKRNTCISITKPLFFVVEVSGHGPGHTVIINEPPSPVSISTRLIDSKKLMKD